MGRTKGKAFSAEEKASAKAETATESEDREEPVWLAVMRGREAGGRGGMEEDEIVTSSPGRSLFRMQ